MRKVKKPVFFIVFAVIALFTLTTIFGVHTQFGDVVKTYVHGVDDIRLGIDIQGGVDVTFEPAGDVDATEEQMDAALETIKLRLANQNISDSETYLDYKSNRIIVRFPWQAGEKDFNPEQAVKELGETAELTFRKGTDTTTDENGDTVPSGDIVLTGADVAQASTGGSKDDTTGDITWVVTLDLNDSGTEKFYEATSELYQSKGQISIWMDNTMVSAPSVNAVISDGKASISGNFTYESAKELADKINSGALPFSLETTSFKTISPTMGEGALTAMVIARRYHPGADRDLHDRPVPPAGRGGIHHADWTGCRYAGGCFRLVRLYVQHHADDPWYCRYHPVCGHGRRCEHHHRRAYP